MLALYFIKNQSLNPIEWHENPKYIKLWMNLLGTNFAQFAWTWKTTNKLQEKKKRITVSTFLIKALRQELVRSQAIGQTKYSTVYAMIKNMGKYQDFFGHTSIEIKLNGFVDKNFECNSHFKFWVYITLKISVYKTIQRYEFTSIVLPTGSTILQVVRQFSSTPLIKTSWAHSRSI